jgi:hypothetical protein
MKRAGPVAGFAVALAAGAGAAATAARARSVDVRRPEVLVVGVPSLGARAARVDGARSGLSRTPLPAKQVHTAWRTSAGVAIEQAPLVDEDGTVYLIGSRGEVVALGQDGEERWRSTTGASQPGPGALLSDRTLVFVDGAGQAVAVRDGVVQWRTPFGQRTPCPSPTCPAPLPLEDGGVVVATAHELAVLDGSGQPRARIPLPEPSTAPLVSALGQVVVLSTVGTLWTWSPGAPDLVRAGAFGAPVDGSVALADDHTVLGAASGQAHLAAVDLLHGTTTLRAAAAGGAWLGPPAMRGATAYVVLLTSTAETAVAIDASGAEQGRALLAVHAPLLVDAGTSPVVAPPHCGALVDTAGTMAFSTTEGGVGVVAGLGSASPTVELIADACPASSTSAHPLPPVAGLAPLPPAQFVAVCTSGAVLAIASGAAGRHGGHR